MSQKISLFFKSILKSIFFDDQRKYFSRTSMMNFVFFFFAIITWIILLSVFIIHFKESRKLDSVFAGIITAYAAGITGGGFLQYSYNKIIRNKNNSNSMDE